MHFNGDKFECIRFWPNNTAAPEFDYQGPDGESIQVKDSLKDLGVYLSSDLSFQLQVEKIVAAASRIAGWALRTFRGRSKLLMLTVLKTLI